MAGIQSPYKTKTKPIQNQNKAKSVNFSMQRALRFAAVLYCTVEMAPVDGGFLCEDDPPNRCVGTEGAVCDAHAEEAFAGAEVYDSEPAVAVTCQHPRNQTT